MDISARLREVMRAARVPSAKKLAEMSGVSQTMISKILRGAATPTTTTLEILCAAMGITMVEFYSAKEADPVTLRARIAGVEPSDFLIALQDETEELTDAQLRDILEYARYVKSKSEGKTARESAAGKKDDAEG